MPSGVQDLAQRFRNRAALFSLRAEGGFAPVDESRFYSEIADIYKMMSDVADEVGKLTRLLKAIELSPWFSD